MEISAATWNTLSELLDEALDLEPAARAAWLDQLTATQPVLAQSMRRLLAAHACSETVDVLARLPGLPSSDRLNSSSLAPGDLIGPYRLKRELGAGGMADVWLAERADGAFTRDVALKLPLINLLRRDLVQRFARERDILARLEHPHIARLYDAGISGEGLPYLSMEYVDGNAITQYCDTQRLDIPARLRLFAQVLDAVQYAHAHLVIHRDLKPSNILVTGDGQARLLDFGIAKLLEGEAIEETQLTRMAGRALTPDYASPEQIKGEPLTIASDVYSLGVVLFELLTGARPYKLKLKSAAQLEQAIVDAEAAAPSASVNAEAAGARSTAVARLVRTLRGDLDNIVRKALAKTPLERYATVADFAADLRRYARGEPVLARPSSWHYRMRKFVTRYRWAVVGGGAVSGAVLVGAGVSLYQANLARAQAERAEEVTRFVLSIFEGAYTRAGASRLTTATELLAQARERLAATPITDISTRVQLLTSIGVSTLLLGDRSEALQVLEQAASMAAEHLQPADPRRATAELNLARALLDKGDVKRARAPLIAAESAMRTNRDDVGLAEALRMKVWVLLSERKLDAAVETAQQGVQLAEKLPAAQAKVPLRGALQAQAAALNAAQRNGELEAAERGLAVAIEIHGSNPSATVAGMRGQVAAALIAEAEFERAVAEFKVAIQDMEQLLGPEHREVMLLFNSLGHASWRRGDNGGAIEAFSNALRIERLLSGGRSARMVSMQSNLAMTYCWMGRFAECEAELGRADEMARGVVEPTSDLFLALRAGRIRLLTRTGRIAEADALLAELAATPTTAPAAMLARQAVLGELRSAQGRHDEAEAALTAAVDGYSKHKRFVIEWARALSALGTARIAAKRTQEAVAPLQQSVATYKKFQTVGSAEQTAAETAIAGVPATAAASLGR